MESPIPLLSPSLAWPPLISTYRNNNFDPKSIGGHAIIRYNVVISELWYQIRTPRVKLTLISRFY